MIASSQTILKRKPILDIHPRTKHRGMTFGLGPASYDIRIAQDLNIPPGGFALGSALEVFSMPNDMAAVVHDKSSWARLGLCVQNTFIDPGFRGFLTLEFTNHLPETKALDGSPRGFPHGWIQLKSGDPIAQIVFHMLDEPTNQPYSGKYQNQLFGPQPAIMEHD